VEDYKPILYDFLKDYAHKPSHDVIGVEIIVDRDERHYDLMLIGWDRQRRIHGTVLHLGLIGDKIWIQHDGTDRGFALDLVEAGVPCDDIILAFKPPDVWPLTN